MVMKKNKTKKQSLQEEPLAPQIGQPASFDLTVITSDSFDDDEFDQEDVSIKVVPYIDEETPGSRESVPSSQISNNQQRLKVSKYSIRCGSISLSALKGAVILVLVLLLAVFIVVLAKSGKAFGKW
jgi:hypothetical protein